MKKMSFLPRPKFPITKVEQFLDVHPKELARQLTLIVSTAQWAGRSREVRGKNEREKIEGVD